ncbi:Uncharacterised protein [Mycobacteroides abscessus subsp. massiliense]|nr:Uncharacterised protein [Mycobacteroides abscessus subsp. massiliense]SKR71284.1 Uncharacterised protein [Mycobacteroides abscessus subsp. massiliense]SLF31949.1 Uncharacterised protein [Mycobacteroides abscessus subsp. massiliense]SLJ06440.1 Uncharacterised protein [Mycobacteroides abscessus subsp. massiliense]
MPIQYCLQQGDDGRSGHPIGCLQHDRLVELGDRSVNLLQPPHDRSGSDRTGAFVERLAGGVCGANHLGQPRHRLLDKDVAGATREAHHPHRGGHLHRQDAVAAQLEERIVYADPLKSENLGVDRGQRLLHHGRRAAVPLNGPVLRCRQGIPVELAVNGQRQGLQDHDRGRHHVRRQPVRQRFTQFPRIGAAGEITDQSLVAGSVLAGDHRDLIDSLQRRHSRLDFAKFDAVPTNLDLLVRTSQIPQLPIGSPAHQIPGTIHPRAPSAERTSHKPCCRQRRPAGIAVPHPGAGHIQLPDRTGL